MKHLLLTAILFSYLHTSGQTLKKLDYSSDDTSKVFKYYNEDIGDSIYALIVDIYKSGGNFYPYENGTRYSILENNSPLTIIDVRNDSVFEKIYFKDGKMQALNIHDKNTGAWLYKEYYYPNGQLKLILPLMTDSIFPYKEFYSNGTLKLQANYFSGAYFGEYKSYYENGRIESQGHYGQAPFDLKNWLFEPGHKEGPWYYYNSDGQLMKIENYMNGKIVDGKK